MKEHMGYLVKRVFLNEDIKDNHFIDFCVTHRNEEMLWYCCKSDARGMFCKCFNKKQQELFFDKIGTSIEDNDFEEKVQSFFKEINSDDYAKTINEICDDGSFGNIPGCIKFDRESDPHVLMADKSEFFNLLSNDMCENFVFEMIMNSVQEFQLGEATEVKIKISGDTYEISDDGSGIAVEDSTEFKDLEWKRILIYPNIIFLYPEMFSGRETESNLFDSKYYCSGYFKKSPKYYYKASMPKDKEMPGRTLAHAQCYAKSMQITTVRKSNRFLFEFENGYCASGRKMETANHGERGTHIIWTPDKCCFYKTNIPFENISSFLERQAFLNPGIKISLDHNGTKYDYCFQNGMMDYAKVKLNKSLMLSEKMKYSFSAQYPNGIINDQEIEIVIGMSKNGFLESFHNYRKMTYGVTVEKIYKIIAKWFNDYVKKTNLKLQHKEYENVHFTVGDIKKHFCVIISSLAEYSSFTNESLKGLDDKFFEVAVKDAVGSILSQCIGGLWPSDEKIARGKVIVDMLLAFKNH